MPKVGKHSIQFENVYCKTSASIVGPKESHGPLAGFFDRHYDDLRLNMESWEQAEIKLIKDAIDVSLAKAAFKIEDIDFIIGGDLNNQLVAHNYAMRDISVPFFGVFGACSTSVEAIILAANIIDAGNARNIIAITSSHNATAERQFRYPTEYGGQRPDTITSTVTASGAMLLTNEDNNLIKITKATVGRVFDAKIKDSLDMGRVMAPAAVDTLINHLNDFKIDPTYYDLIITGDLSYYGRQMLLKLCKEYNLNLELNSNDAGLMIYNRDKQDVFAGGSGCGCCAAVMNGYIVQMLKLGTLKRVLVVATGALHNPVIIAQKETIPAIAYAVALERME